MIQGQIAMAEMSQELSELGLQDSSIAQDAQRHATYLTARALIFSIPRWIIILVAPIMMVVLFRKQDGSD